MTTFIWTAKNGWTRRDMLKTAAAGAAVLAAPGILIGGPEEG